MITPEVETLKELVVYIRERYGDRLALQIKGRNGFVRFSYKEVADRAFAIAGALQELGIKKGDKVAVIGENRPEWAMSYLGVMASGAIVVPIDPFLKGGEVAHIVNVAEVSCVIASGKFVPMFEEIRELLHSVKAFITMEDEGEEGWYTFPEIIERGDRVIKSDAFIEYSVSKDDIAAIIFTSGTTGKAKGVMLSHYNIVFDADSASRVIVIQPTDMAISILPLHHTFECTAGFIAVILRGGAITYARSLKPNEIVEDIRDAGVTIMLGVPLLFEKILSGIQRKLREQPAPKRALIGGLMGMTKGLRKLGFEGAGRVLFKSLREKAGMGRLRIMVSGGAALRPDVEIAFREFGFPILQGYGLTETSPVLTVNPLDKPKVGSVGLPIPGAEIDIHNPDEDGVGEIIARGPMIMQGYYKDEEETRKVLKDGWFFTGDLGYIDEDGYLYITGRAKNVIVSAAGKNIYPEEIERELLKSPIIEEVLVVGRYNAETKREEVWAIVYPNFEAIAECESPDEKECIERVLKEEIRKYCQNLAEYKRVQAFQVIDEEFPKTTTRKIKRYLFTDKAVRL